MRSRKAQRCQAPPDNPETGDTDHSRESRSCAGEKIEHQNECKRHSSSSAGTYVYKRGYFPQTRDLWRKSANMGYRVGRVSSRAVSSWSRSPSDCGFRGVFWVGRIFFRFFLFCSYFFESTRPTASTRQPCLMYLSTSTSMRSGGLELTKLI